MIKPINFNTKAPDIHRSISTLPIYSFRKIIETGDLSFFVKGNFEEQKYEFTDSEIKMLSEVLDNILDELDGTFTKLNVKLKDLNTQFLILQLEFKYNTTINVLDLYSNYQHIEVALLLKELGWKLDTSRAIGPQVDSIIQKCKGLLMTINIQKSKYVKEKKAKEKKAEDSISLDKEALYLQHNLELGYEINTKTTTVERWYNLKKLHQEKMDHLKNLENNG